MVREVSQSLPVVWGGVHASLLPGDTIKSEYVDIIVIGDGEETFAELVRALQNGSDLKAIKGIVYKQGESIVQTAVRGQFAIGQGAEVGYDLIDMERYKSKPAWTERESLPVITSRGCPHRCGYCYNTEFSGRRWTALSAEQVVALIEGLVGRYGIEGVFLLDDNFFVDMRRVGEICELLIAKDLGVSIYNANCRVDTLNKMDEELLVLLKRAGFEQLFIGVESGSDEVLCKIKKDITVEQVLGVNRRLKRMGIRPFYSFMAGFPFETIADIKKTLGLMKHLLRENDNAIVYRLQLFTAFPGTELFSEERKRGMQFPETLEGWAEFHYDKISHDGFGRKQRKFLRDFHYYTTFLDKKLSADRGWCLRTISHWYSDILGYRLDHGIYGGLLELYPLKAGQGIRNRLLQRC